MNLLNIEPSVVSKDLKGYVIGIYGQSGAGKTTTAAQFGNSIIMDTELGTKALPGVYRQPVLSWVDALTFVNQIKRPEVKEKFDTIVIDTIGALVKHAEKFVLDKFGAKDLNDSQALPFGKGHTELEKMFYHLFNTILQNDYGLIVVGHEKNVVDQDTEERFMDIDIANKRVKKYIVSLLDVLMYVEKTRSPDQPNTVYFKTTEKAEAKCRFPNVIPKANFNHSNIVNALQDAIGDHAVDEQLNLHKEEEYSEEEFEKLKEECETKARQIIEKNPTDAESIIDLIEKVMGKKIGETSVKDVPVLRDLKEELDNR